MWHLMYGLSKYDQRHKLQDNWFKLIKWFMSTASWWLSKFETQKKVIVLHKFQSNVSRVGWRVPRTFFIIHPIQSDEDHDGYNQILIWFKHHQLGKNRIEWDLARNRHAPFIATLELRSECNGGVNCLLNFVLKWHRFNDINLAYSSQQNCCNHINNHLSFFKYWDLFDINLTGCKF